MPPGRKMTMMMRIENITVWVHCLSEEVRCAVVERLDDTDQHAADDGADRLPTPPSTAAVNAIRPRRKPAS